MAKKILIPLAIMAGIVVCLLLFLILVGNSIDLKCMRSQGQGTTCQISQEFLGRISTSSRTVTDVMTAQVEQNCNGNNGCSYRPILVTSSGDSFPVNNIFTNYGPVTQQVSQISALLQGSQQDFELKMDPPWSWWPAILSAGIGGIGLFMVLILMIKNLIGMVRKNN
jgi:hypothetical protein